MTTFDTLATVMGIPVSAHKVDDTTFLIQAAPPSPRSRFEHAGTVYRVVSVEQVVGEESVWELTVEKR